jgi:parvulin-like peptidyl-prolyl isomerase
LPKIAFPRRVSAAVFISLGCLAALGAGCAKDEPVARVNGEAILTSEFERQWVILKSLRPETKSDGASQRQLLEQMVKQELLVAEAKKAGLDRDPAVKDAMNRQRAAVRAELEATIQGAQAQLAQLDRAVEQKILIEKFLDLKGARAGAPGRGAMIERLVDEAKPLNQVELFPDAAAKAKLD